MRTEVQIDGITYSRKSADELRCRATPHIRLLATIQAKVDKFTQLADRIEAELSKPEPLVGGDIVIRGGGEGRRFLVLDGFVGHMLNAEFGGCGKGSKNIRITDGETTWPVFVSELTKVGNINDGAK